MVAPEERKDIEGAKCMLGCACMCFTFNAPALNAQWGMAFCLLTSFIDND